MYRVNFGGGQVWHFPTRKECVSYIAAARRDSSDPYSSRYFIERKDPETGDWFPSKGHLKDNCPFNTTVEV